jgi:hypothetical protein
MGTILGTARDSSTQLFKRANDAGFINMFQAERANAWSIDDGSTGWKFEGDGT